MIIAIAGIIFAAAASVAYVGLSLVFSDDARVSRRLREMTKYEAQQAMEAEPLLKPFTDRVLRPVGGSFVRMVRALFPRSHREALRVRIIQAGLAGSISAERTFAAQVLCGAAAALLAAVVGLTSGSRIGSVIFFVAVAAVVAFLLPDVWLRSRRSARKSEMIRELPDMLDLLTISVEAGLGFDAALTKLIRSRKNALAEEFGHMLQEVQAGASRREALRNLAERTDVSEVNTFVTAIIQADMFGVSIASVLRTQAGEMRLKRRQHAEEEAQKAPVKMVIPLVLCILPATMIVIMGPAVVRISTLFSG